MQLGGTTTTMDKYLLRGAQSKHLHCPAGCKYSQPFYKNGIAYCGRHYYIDDELIEMVHCTFIESTSSNNRTWKNISIQILISLQWVCLGIAIYIILSVIFF